MDNKPPTYEEATRTPYDYNLNSTNGIPTLKPYSDFNVKHDVQNLLTALKNKSKDETLLILCKRSSVQRLEISEQFFSLTNKTLVSMIKDKFAFDSKFRLFIMGFTIPYSEYLARYIHQTAHFFHWLFYLLFTIPTKDVVIMKEYFFQKYKMSVYDYIKLLMRRNERMYGIRYDILTMLKYERIDKSIIDQKLIGKDIELLNKLKGNSPIFGAKESDLDVLNDIFLTRNFQHLKLLCEEFFTKNNLDIKEFFKKVTPNRTLYKHVAEYSINKEYYLARTLYKGSRGLAGEINIFNHIFITRAEIDLHSIKLKFKEDYGEDLSSKVMKHFSGAYRNSLLQILNENI